MSYDEGQGGDEGKSIRFSNWEFTYAMVCMKLDIKYMVGIVSRFTYNPKNEHWTLVKWITR